MTWREAYDKGYRDGIKAECDRWRELLTRWIRMPMCDAPDCRRVGQVVSS